MQLSVRGMIIKKFFQQIGQYFNNVGIDIYAIMPNHIHAIIIIKDVVDVDNGVVNYCRDGVIPSLQMEKSAINKPTLGQIIGYFKYQTTKNINQINKTVGIKIWQPRYYEHIIRDDDGLNKIRQYILNNPKNWNLDKNNPEHC
ncbi:MAG: transposase [Candidatus Komeilibacteria bacterium]|nr:transposase [Candidatus Komeilibacteria bacterium]